MRDRSAVKYNRTVTQWRRSIGARVGHGPLNISRRCPDFDIEASRSLCNNCIPLPISSSIMSFERELTAELDANVNELVTQFADICEQRIPLK